MIVAGVGFRSGVEGAALAGLVAQALAQAGQAGTPIAALATLESISRAPGFIEAARRLDTRALGLPHEALAARDAECLTRSERSLAAHALGSVAEAAALAAAGPGSRLVLARIANATATCALAAASTDGSQSPESSKILRSVPPRRHSGARSEPGTQTLDLGSAACRLRPSTDGAPNVAERARMRAWTSDGIRSGLASRPGMTARERFSNSGEEFRGEFP